MLKNLENRLILLLAFAVIFCIISCGMSFPNGNGFTSGLYGSRERVSPSIKTPEQPDFSVLKYSEFKEKVKSKEIVPPKNAADLVLRALTRGELAPKKRKSGLMEYPVFSERSDGRAVYGNTLEIHELMRAITTQARKGANDSGILLMGESGTGKSAILTVIEQAVVDETAKRPVYVIKGCPINEFATRLEKPQDLCPHCRAAIAELRKNQESISDVEVEPVEFGEGRGIAHADPTLTKIGGSEGADYWTKVRMKAGGGVLVVSEVTDQNIDMVLGQAKDYLRAPDPSKGRRVSHREEGQTYYTDTLVIGATTPAELQKYWDKIDANDASKKASKPLKERLVGVNIRYNLEQTAETKIYEQLLEGITQAHRSPQLLQVAAEVAMLTRIENSTKVSQMTAYKKMQLMDGRKVDELTIEDAEKVMEESRSILKDGTNGVTSVQMSRLLTDILTEAGDACPGKQCVTPVEFLGYVQDTFARRADQSVEKDSKEGAEKVVKVAEEALDHYNVWLVKTLLEAFTPNYHARMTSAFKNYADMIEFLLNPDNNNQPREALGAQQTGSQIEKELTSIEAFVPGLRNADAFRQGVLNEIGQVMKKRKEEAEQMGITQAPDESDVWQEDLPHIRQLKEGLHRKLSGGAMQDQLNLVGELISGKKLESLPFEVREKLADIAKRLVKPHVNGRLAEGQEQGYGFCPCCVDKLMRYAAGLIRKPEFIAQIISGTDISSSRR